MEAFTIPPRACREDHLRWGGFCQASTFDAAFFGIPPFQAERMDPQQRLLLEVAWEALERAGLPPEGLAGTQTGVFMGLTEQEYGRLHLRHAQDLDAWSTGGNSAAMASGRLSLQLGLQGPSMTVDTACSSSLVAVHLAMASLRSGESDLALAGGVTLMLTPAVNVAASQSRLLASDGRRKPFDALADGLVWSEGCGVVVLKRLAEADRDPIWPSCAAGDQPDGGPAAEQTRPEAVVDAPCTRLGWARSGRDNSGLRLGCLADALGLGPGRRVAEGAPGTAWGLGPQLQPQYGRLGVAGPIRPPWPSATA